MLCDAETIGAREANGYPGGREYVVRKGFPEAVMLARKRKSWNLVYASDGMDAELLTDYYVATDAGERKGHLVVGAVLWYTDFFKGGQHEDSCKSVD